MAYFYLIPVIDIGLSIRVSPATSRLSHLDARVTVLQPGTSCLLCREVIDSQRMAADGTRRADPERFEQLKAEGYIVGGGDPSPSVVTFTTEAASMAVEELIQRLTCYRGVGQEINQRYRHFLDGEDKTTAESIRKGCQVCSSTGYWGRSDSEPYLAMAL